MSSQHEIIKIRIALNKIETKIQRINETEFFQKISKTDKHLTKRQKEINKIRNKRGT